MNTHHHTVSFFPVSCASVADLLTDGSESDRFGQVQRGRLFASLDVEGGARQLQQCSHMLNCVSSAGSSSMQTSIGSPISWLSPPRTPSAAYLWLWTGLRHLCSVECYQGGSRKQTEDITAICEIFEAVFAPLCRFGASLNTPQKRSEVETGLGR